MSSKSITELNLNSITISNSNFSNSKGYTAQSNTLETNNSGVLLVNGIPISSGGGGVDDIIEGTGISVDEVSTGVFEITNTGVLSIADGTNISITEDTPGNFTINSTGGGGGVNNITPGTGINVTESPAGTFEIENVGVTSLIQGDGINLDFTTGDITVSSTVNPTDYYTVTNADATFQTQADMANYSTTAEADALYQTLTDMANYSTTAEADALYQPIGNAFLTQATADTLYYPLGNIYFYLGLANLTAMPPQTSKGVQIDVPYYSHSTSAILISATEGATVDSVVCNAYWVSSTLSPANTTLELSFYNSSVSYTVNTGMNYTILIINV